MEYLLWTIERDEQSKESFKKVNTLKVALFLAPKEYFIRDDKYFYNTHLSKVTKDYLKCINKQCIKVVKEWWSGKPFLLDNTGYSVFFHILVQN